MTWGVAIISSYLVLFISYKRIYNKKTKGARSSSDGILDDVSPPATNGSGESTGVSTGTGSGLKRRG